jgi:putative endonuclease
MARSTESRRAAHARGHWAEALALALLVAKGYRPLARRFSAAGGEIDLVVRRGDLVAFVEVKARASLDAALLSIDGRKRQRFARAARAWIARQPPDAAVSYRADAVLVAPRRWPRHVEGAFELAGF